jgi:DNA-binding NtrC family response regulator
MSRILIVDDEQSVLDITRAILEKYQHTALCAKNADEAISLIEKEKPDAALVDIILKGRGGLDLLMEIHESWPDMPVLVMSGKIDAGKAHFSALASRFGAGTVLPKPFTATELIESINKTLKL